MRLLAVSFALAAACATAKPAATASAAPARDCGAKMVPAVADINTEVHAGPDGNAAELTTYKSKTPVCVSSDSLGFGFRRVKLSDGRTGYISESDLSLE
jgi:hypothetical protein